MKFRTKVVVCMISILSIIFGAGSSALILNSFNSALDREKKSAIQSYEMILNTLKVVNGVEAWADSKDISNTIKEMSTQRNTSWAGIHIYTEKNESCNQDSDSGRGRPHRYHRCIHGISGSPTSVSPQVSTDRFQCGSSPTHR